MSFLLLMISFVLSGLSSVSNKALVEWGLSSYLYLYLLGFYMTAAAMGVSIMLARREESSTTDRWIGSLMGFNMAVTTIFFLLALEHMPGIIAFPVRSLGNLVLIAVVSIIAWKEKLSRNQWVGVLLSLIAIWLVY